VVAARDPTSRDVLLEGTRPPRPGCVSSSWKRIARHLSAIATEARHEAVVGEDGGGRRRRGGRGVRTPEGFLKNFVWFSEGPLV
jgi:hypothetical protein